MFIFVLLKKFGREPDVLHIWELLEIDYPDYCVIQIPILKVVCVSSVVIYCSMKKSRIEGTVVVLLLLVILIFVTSFFHFYVVILDVSSVTSISVFLMFSFSEKQI